MPNTIERIQKSPFDDVEGLLKAIREKRGRVIALFFHDNEQASDGSTFVKVWTPVDINREEMRSVVASSVSIFGHLDLIEEAKRRGIH